MNGIHGKFSVTTKADIICYKLMGTFNDDVANTCIAEITQHIKGFNFRPFKLMNVQLELEGATPAAFKRVNEFNAWLNTQKMVAKAIVTNKKELVTMHDFFLPSREVQNIEYFNTEEEALAWLQSLSLAKTDLNKLQIAQ